MLRDAPNDGKRPPLSALEATPCGADDRCALKARCAAAYSLQVQAFDALAAVARATRDPDATVGPDTALLLTRAEADLGRAKGLATECADLEGATRRRYAL